MRTICLAAFIAALLIGCSEKSSSPTAGTGPATNASTSTSANPLDAPGQYVGALGKGQQNAIKTVDTASLKQAVQLFNVDKGRNPKDLNELVQEKYIPKIPPAPRGMKLDYNATSGEIRVVQE